MTNYKKSNCTTLIDHSWYCFVPISEKSKNCIDLEFLNFMHMQISNFKNKTNLDYEQLKEDTILISTYNNQMYKFKDISTDVTLDTEFPTGRKQMDGVKTYRDYYLVKMDYESPEQPFLTCKNFRSTFFQIKHISRLFSISEAYENEKLDVNLN